jgi:hypothetical protein
VYYLVVVVVAGGDGGNGGLGMEYFGAVMWERWGGRK